MMILNYLLLLAGTLSIFRTIKTKKMLSAIVTLRMVVGVILTLFLSKTIENGGI